MCFAPRIYVTVIAHTPFLESIAEQVLIQGFLLMQETVYVLLDSIYDKVVMFENSLAQMTAATVGRKTTCDDDVDTNTFGLFDNIGKPAAAPNTPPVPMVTPDAGIINMLRYGILALQLLPENTSAGIVVVTDGITGPPDTAMFESLLVQLRNSTIACSFLNISSPYHPACSLGYVPYMELLQFIATATFGAFMSYCPNLENDSSLNMNVYHKAILSWSFQKPLHGYKGYQDGMPAEQVEQYWHIDNLNFGPSAPEEALLRKKHAENKATMSVFGVLSVRLREGYTIKKVAITKGDTQLEVQLVLPWKHRVNIEYRIEAVWPLDSSKRVTHTEVSIEATYDFLDDVMSPTQKKPLQSGYRMAVIRKFWQTMQGLTQTDQLLQHLQLFGSNLAHYTLPDCVKNGVPLFYFSPNTNTPVLSSQTAHSPFASFWKPICRLDINVWQKWLHTHRIGVILEHDVPLPKYLHLPSSTGRYNIVQCRQALMGLNVLLKEWSTFILVENHSYIKFLEREGDGPPKSFYILRVTSKPPCMVLRVAFQGGTPGYERNQIVNQVREKLLGLSLPQRRPQEGQIGQIQRSRSHIDCCVLLAKPVEKILIRYEKLPTDFLVGLHQTHTVSPYHSMSSLTSTSTTNKNASSMFSTLSRYLHHQRWVWGAQNETAYPISMQALGKILATLTKVRLQEGFHFAYSNSGVVNMVLEVQMKSTGLADKTPVGSPVRKEASEKTEEEPADDDTFSCVVQYILFPPHTALTREIASEDDLEMELEGAETDGELQIITECWIEPQDGVVCCSPEERQHFIGCTYKQLAKQLFPIDHECISTVLVFEHLNLLCQKDAHPDLLQPTLGTPLQRATAQPSITYVPFMYDLMKVVDKCQQVELLFSTFLQGATEDSGTQDRSEELTAHCTALVTVFSDCFVTGIYSSLQFSYEIDSQDVQFAVDGICVELVLEEDLTKFMTTVCGDAKRRIDDAARQVACKKVHRHQPPSPGETMDAAVDRSTPSDKHKSSVLPRSPSPKQLIFDLDMIPTDVSCESIEGLHQHIQDRFMTCGHTPALIPVVMFTIVLSISRQVMDVWATPSMLDGFHGRVETRIRSLVDVQFTHTYVLLFITDRFMNVWNHASTDSGWFMDVWNNAIRCRWVMFIYRVCSLRQVMDVWNQSTDAHGQAMECEAMPSGLLEQEGFMDVWKRIDAGDVQTMRVVALRTGSWTCGTKPSIAGQVTWNVWKQHPIAGDVLYACDHTGQEIIIETNAREPAIDRWTGSWTCGTTPSIAGDVHLSCDHVQEDISDKIE
ncbi:PREDICTED: protein SZT2-like [Priapulus caudatus]|uniref:Protein SZT2-like n=1 Tax=Priapulus caudatus TaxID=37621 RepID=A0ABM1E8F6_PRICU|nr:PREDICTED: protein SZT2-like [Priapulus caudatus]